MRTPFLFWSLAVLLCGAVRGEDPAAPAKDKAGAKAGVRTASWLTPLGDWKTIPIREVVAERDGHVEVVGKDGRKLRIPFRQIVEIAREGPELADLLAARRHVRHGHALDRAVAVLDRYAVKGAEPWIKEYALAARIAASSRLGEKDFDRRAEAFLKAYPKSRFRWSVSVAQARVFLMTGPGILEDRMTARLPEVFESVRKERGPLFDQYETHVLGAEAFAAFGGLYDLAKFLKGAEGSLNEGRHKLGPDEALALDRGLIRMRCFELWMTLDKHAKAKEPAPHVRLTAGKLLRRATFQHPAVLAELHLILGATELSCGNKAGARRAYEKAAAAAAKDPDPYWRERAKASLDDL